METKWQLRTPDGAVIYGVKNSTQENARSAVFIVHGLSGNMYEYHIKRAADELQTQHDVYRFNLYEGLEGGRMLLDCTIKTHADDLNTVLREFGPQYEKIFLIGHSYGGPTVMMANPDRVTAVSLWDPSFDLNQIQKDFSKNYVEGHDYYTINWGVSYLISKAMYEEAGRLNEEACCQLAKDFKAPVQVIHAGDGYYVTKDKSYHSFGHAQNIREIVPGTVHCFYEGDTCDELLGKTGRWFERFMA